MRINKLRFFPLIVTVIVFLASFMVMVPRSNQVLKNDTQETDNNEAFVFSAPGLPRGTRANPPWPMHLGDLAHSGYSTSLVPNNNSILWSNTTGNGDGYGSPVVADGKVFVGSADGYLYCFDLYNGIRLWRTYLNSGDFGVCGTPAVYDDHVYVFCSGDDALHSMWTSNGTIDWSYDPGGGAYGGTSPAVTSDRVYFGSGNRYLYCLNRTTGNMVWSYQTGNGPVRPYGIQSSPAVANGRVFVGSCDTYLYCFNEFQPTAPSANYLWRTSLSDAIFGSPAVVNGRVYCGSGYYVYSEGTNSHTTFCLDELTGSVIWSYLTGSDILSSPAIAYGNCYFTSTDGELYCVDAMSAGPTPTLHWSNTTGDTWSSPAVADGKVVVGSRGTNRIYCFDATTGMLLWDDNVGNDIYSSPAIADNKVVISVRGNPESVICYGSAVTFSVDYIVLEDVAHNELTTVVLNIGETVKVYAAGYNATFSTFVKYVEVDWTGSGGTWSPGTGTSSTFTAGTVGGQYPQFGLNSTMGVSDDFNINIPLVDYIVIEDNAHNELTTVDLSIGETVTAYAAGYNSTFSTFVEYVEVDWTGGGGTWSPGTGISSSFTAGTAGGMYPQNGQNSTMGVSDDFNINIIPPTLDYISLTDGIDGPPYGTVSLPIGGLVTAYASGYNSTGPTYVGLIDVDWSDSGGTWFPSAGTSSTFTAGNVGGLFVQTGENTTLGVLDTFNVDVQSPTLDYILITDEADGNELSTVTMPIVGTVTAYASGYNNTDSTYVGLVDVEWLGPGGNWLPTNGTSSTFTAGALGGVYLQTGQNLTLGVSDSFNVDIINATLDYIEITDSPNGNPLTTVTVLPGGSVDAFASGYNNTGPSYVGLIEVNWYGPGGTWAPIKYKNSTFKAGATAGLYTQTGENATLGVLDTFNVSISDWEVDYILITNGPNGTQLNNVSLPIGGTVTVYASGYNTTLGDYVGLVEVEWDGLGGGWSPGMGTSSTFTAGTLDGFYTQTGQNLTLGVLDTFNIDVQQPTLDYIRLTDFPDGAPLTTVTVPLGGSLTAYASGYNNTGPTYVALVEVEWLGPGGNWLPTNGTNSTFTAGALGGEHLQTGQNLTLGVSDTFNVDIIDATLDYIVITDSPNGTPLVTVTLPIGGFIKAYASGYNTTGSTYVGLIAVDWTGPGGSWSNSTGTSSVFTSGFSGGSFTQTGQNTGLGVSDTFNVEILNATLDFIIITNRPGETPLSTVELPVGGNIIAYASGYNNTGPTYIGLVEVNWIGSGGVWSPSIDNSSTFSAGTIDGFYSQTGQNLTLGIFDTFNVNILPPTLDYIRITDEPDGMILGTVDLPIGGSVAVYVSGYNNTASIYVGLIEVSWIGSGGIWSPTTGSSSTFSAGLNEGSYTQTGQNLILGVYDTFFIEVLTPTLDYILLTDSPGGEELDSVELPIGGSVDAYASGYNNTGSLYLFLVEVDWSQSTYFGPFSQIHGHSTTYTAGMLGGTTTITGMNSALDVSDDFTIIILEPTIDYIQIRNASDNLGDVVGDATFTLEEEIRDTYYCAAYNHTKGYIGDVSAEWAISTDIGTLSVTSGISTNFTAINAGTGYITVNRSGIMNSTGTITVNPAEDDDVIPKPSSPTNVTVRAISSDEIEITWSLNPESDVIGYIIQRSTSPTGPWINITTVGGGRTSYIDTDVEPETTYYYRVIARGSDASESPPSFTLSSTTPKPEEASWLWLWIVIIIIVLLIFVLLIVTRSKPQKVPSAQKREEEEIPPPPPDWEPKEGSPEVSEEEIPEEEIPPPDDEEFPPSEDEIPEEEIPPPEDDFDEGELPPPDDWEPPS